MSDTAVAEQPTTHRRIFSVWGSTGLGYGGNANHKQIEVHPELRILQDGEDHPDDCIIFRVASPEGGDERIVWNPFRIQEVAEARRLFNDLISIGYYAYKIDSGNGGRDGELVRRFEDIIGDGEIIMSNIRPKQDGHVMDKTEVVMHPMPYGG